jgi:hypothetical protein
MDSTQLNWIANFIRGIADDVLSDLRLRAGQQQFMDNESFRRWLTDTVFGMTYEQRNGAV